MFDFNYHDLLDRLDKHKFWSTYLNRAEDPLSDVGVHLAIFSQPFLSNVLTGQKTVESRFSQNRCAPFGEIDTGDIILIKEVSGPIRGIALASETWFYDLAREPIGKIRKRFEKAIGADEEFWLAKRNASFATVVGLRQAAAIEPMEVRKRDRRGWVSLRARQMTFAF